MTVDFVASSAAVASIARVGRPSIAHATATGKVMLAFARGARAPGALDAYTDRTITEPKALRREIEAVRKQGWAQAVREREADLNALAAPVFGGQRRSGRGARHPGPRRPVPPATTRGARFPLCSRRVRRCRRPSGTLGTYPVK